MSEPGRSPSDGTWRGAPGWGGLRRRFELLGELGRGAMGVVYRARDLELGREVALKLPGAASERGLARFQREGQLLAAMRHPNVLTVHAYGVEAGRPWLAMELVPGARPLSEACEGLDRAGRVALIAGAARGLGHAHARGVVHRDVKPENLLVGADGRVLVGDFGLGLDAASEAERLTQTGTLLGTPQYMSPEALSGSAEAAQPASDVWGLGVILFEALCGRHPFPAGSLGELAARVQEHELDFAAGEPVPAALEGVCRRALALSPSARYPDGDALADDLEAWARGEPVAAGRAGTSWSGWAAVVGLALVGVGLAGVLRLGGAAGPGDAGGSGDERQAAEGAGGTGGAAGAAGAAGAGDRSEREAGSAGSDPAPQSGGRRLRLGARWAINEERASVTLARGAVWVATSREVVAWDPGSGERTAVPGIDLGGLFLGKVVRWGDGLALLVPEGVLVVAPGQARRTLPTGKEPLALAASEAGGTLAVGTTERVLLFGGGPPASGQGEGAGAGAALPDSGETWRRLAFSGDGTLLAGLTRSGRVVVWDVARRVVLQDLVVDPWGETLALDRAGTRLAIGTRAGRILVRDPRSGAELPELLELDGQRMLAPAAHRAEVRGLCMSPDGEWMFSGSEKAGVLNLRPMLKAWRWSGGRPALVASLELDDDVTDLSITPDGRWVVARLRNGVAAWEVVGR